MKSRGLLLLFPHNTLADFLVLLLLYNQVSAYVKVKDAHGTIELDKTCIFSYDCEISIPNSHCDYFTGLCSCRPYHIPFNNTTCLPASLLGFECKIDIQCQLKVQNSQCVNGICECVDNYLPVRKDKCFPPAEVGEFCLNNRHCLLWSNHSYCSFIVPKIYGKCRCPRGYFISEENKCLPYLGSSCESHRECTTITKFSHCQEERRICECKKEFQLSSKGNTCLSVQEKDASSESENNRKYKQIAFHCFCEMQKNAMMCDCWDGFHISSNGTTSSHVEGTGKECEQNEEFKLITLPFLCEQQNNATICEYLDEYLFTLHVSTSISTIEKGVVDDDDDEAHSLIYLYSDGEQLLNTTLCKSVDAFRILSNGSTYFPLTTKGHGINHEDVREYVDFSTLCMYFNKAPSAVFDRRDCHKNHTTGIGSKCEANEECENSIPNSYCKHHRLNAHCECLHGFQVTSKGTSCQQTEETKSNVSFPTSLGKKCMFSAECQALDPYSDCISGICDCIHDDGICNAKNTGCYNDTFQCTNGYCISWYFVCDKMKNCADNSDEDICIHFNCPKQVFQCDDGTCLSRSQFCNGVSECPDGSDEARCYGGNACDSNSLHCQDGQCLPEHTFCNAIQDCTDGSDEIDEICHGALPCPEEHFHCHNGQCRSTAILCSDEDGCGDNSDELNCQVCKSFDRRL